MADAQDLCGVGVKAIAEMQHQYTAEQHVALLTSFMHDLIRDCLPTGKIEALIKETEKLLATRAQHLQPLWREVKYDDPKLQLLAEAMAKRILGVK